MKNQIPTILLYSRLVFVVIILALAMTKPANAGVWVLMLMYAGIVTDIFDGIIARKLNISTQKFRLLDTVFDLLFYFSILYFVYSVNPSAIRDNVLLVVCILTLESLMYTFSLTRFSRLPSPHAILSKFWALYMVVEFSLLILGIPGMHFRVALLFGLIVHLDRVLIYLLLRQWEHDIPSSYHALLLRQGKEITRRKIFNG